MPGQWFTVVWLVGGVVTIALMGFVTASTLESQGWLGYMRLTKGGQTTQGTVVHVDPKNHCRADYRFEVGGNSFRGSGADCRARVGAQVRVTYLVADPRRSCLGDAREKFWNEVIPIVLAGVLLPPFVVVSASWNRSFRRWRESSVRRS